MQESKQYTTQERIQAGFTLIELLATIVILALLATMVASAMVTGSRIMARTTTAANASVLASSLDTALSDVLRFASVQAPTGATDLENPRFNSDSYLDASGVAVRGGQIVIQDGKLALNTTGGTQLIPKSAGIYTDFTVLDFQLFYNCENNLFTGSYTLSALGGDFTRTCDFTFRTLSEETTT